MLSMLMTTLAMFAAQIDQSPQAVAAAPAASTPAGSSVAARPARTSKPTQYCIQAAYTGTRMPKKTCKTREEWMRDGIDPTEKQ